MARRTRKIDDLDKTEAVIADKLADYLGSIADPTISDVDELAEIQPPTSVIEEAARAAAAVIVAFERGVRVGSGQ